MALTWAEILAAVDLPREEVKVPEWGGSVWVRTLTGSERADFELGNVKARKATGDGEGWFRDYGFRLLALALCDEAGARLPVDAAALAGKSSVVLDRIVNAAIRLNALGARDSGNSEGTPSDERGSASPSP